MRTYEQAAVRVAIKRSKTAHNKNVGYKYLSNWYEQNKSSLVIDIETVRNEFKAWLEIN